MKHIPIIVLFILPLMLPISCITSEYHKSNKHYTHVHREFQHFKGKYRIYEGEYNGQLERDNKKYYHVHFSGVLKGDNRYLNLYLPSDILGKSIIFDSQMQGSGRKCAYLLFQRACCINDHLYKILLYLKEGEVSDPVKIMKKHLNYELKTRDYPIVLCTLDFSNIFNYSIIFIVWEKSSAGIPFVSKKVIIPGKKYDFNMRITWQERSRTMYAIRMVGYVGTVAADIITSPIQLIAIIVYAVIGPVR
jgi:hypothetical protein